MMQMSPCRYAMMQMPSCGYAMMWVNVLTQTQFIQRFPLFSKSRLPQRLKLKKKIQILICYFSKGHLLILFFLFFWLKAPKKLVITVRNLRIGYLLEIWWSGSKDLFSQTWLSKEVAHFQGIFLEKKILWKSSILKRFIFSSLWIWQFDRRQDQP